jgi:flagellar biosynthetic protein FliR
VSITFGDVQTFLLILTRTLAILVNVPVLAGRNVPHQVQIGFGCLLALAIYTAHSFPAQVGATWSTYGWSIVQEMMVGVLAGMAIRLAFATLEAAARFMNDTIGFGAATLLNPAIDHPGTAFEQFYITIGLLVFLITNGHHQLLRGLSQTFDLVPLQSFVFTAAQADRMLLMSTEMFSAILQIALPVMGTMLMIDLALGLMARAAPQMNVFFVGIPVKIAVGLVILGSTFSLTLPMFSGLFDTMVNNMVKVIR